MTTNQYRKAMDLTPVTVTPVDPAAAVYQLPAMFTNDYAARCLDDSPGRWVRDGKRVVYIRLTTAEASDLLADAKHYADMADDYWDAALKPLGKSAARVVAALARQGVSA